MSLRVSHKIKIISGLTCDLEVMRLGYTVYMFYICLKVMLFNVICPCIISFRFLDKMPVTDDDNSVFTAYSFLIRIFLGIGCTSAFTASFVIASHTFPENGASALVKYIVI